MTKDGKIKIMVVPSDRAGVGYFRSLEPHLFMKNKWDNEVEIDIYYDFGHLQNFQEVIKDYDILHFHTEQSSQKQSSVSDPANQNPRQ